MADSLKSVCVLSLVLLLSSCAVRQPDIYWPQGIPSRTWFQQQWRADPVNAQVQSEEDYLQWVMRFYEGMNLVPGWLNMMAQVESRIPESEKNQVRTILSELGGRIGAEWAKSNQVRKLTTRTAAVWRDALRESLSQNDLHNFLTRLQQDVDALLTGELSNDQIYFERYYVDEFDF